MKPRSRLIFGLECTALVVAQLLGQNGCQGDTGDPSGGCDEVNDPNCAPSISWHQDDRHLVTVAPAGSRRPAGASIAPTSDPPMAAPSGPASSAVQLGGVAIRAPEPTDNPTTEGPSRARPGRPALRKQNAPSSDPTKNQLPGRPEPQGA